MTRYSQNDEQDIILKHFEGKVGRLLDIGAYDGITFSNTRALLFNGWSGVLVEPNPFNFVKLVSNCQVFDPAKVVTVAAALGVTLGLWKLAVEKDLQRGWASSIEERCSKRLLSAKSDLIYVTSVCWDDLLLKFGAHDFCPYDFINIDAEGMDMMLLVNAPSWVFATSLICIEPHDLNERQRMKDILDNRGFGVLHETPENIIAIRK
jgi:FkbM family methyltransferase